MSGRAEEAGLRLILFDVDGTLIDGAPAIVSAMRAAFAAVDRPAPPDRAVRGVIGLDLDVAVLRLDPALSAAALGRAVESYRLAFMQARSEGRAEASSPLYPGARDALERLSRTDALLGIATGKARRGLEHALDSHDLRRFFATTQTSSEGPGKPHPGMIERALAETGAEAEGAAMVGDSTYDMEMARNAGARAVGVSWGYHDAAALLAAGAEIVIDVFEALEPALDRI